MKKALLLIAVIVLTAAGTVSAQGYNTDRSSDRTPPASGFQRGPGIVEIKNLSGDLVLNETTGVPSIRVGREELALMISPAAIEDLKLKNGSKISVKGFEVPDRSWSVTGAKAFRVMELGFEGKTYMTAGGMGSGMPGSGMSGRDKRGYMHDSYNDRMPRRR